MTTYRQRHLDGHHTATQQPAPTPELNPDELPGRHAPLDQLAEQHGITWSAEGLSINAKQNELRDALNQ